MKTSTTASSGLFLILAAVFLPAIQLSAAVTFTVTPAAISNTYAGKITLGITGLNAGATVVVQKFIDANTNGVIDGSDWLAQQFLLTDGGAVVIGGVTNVNIPFDGGSAAGAITAQLNTQVTGVAQRFVGSYAFKLSSPTGQFTPITNFFRITNTAYPQSFTGNVTCNGTNVPNATVLTFRGQAGNSSPNAGVVANNAGAYALNSATGTYSLLAFKPGLVTDATTSPTLALNSGATLSTNLTLLPSTRTISGRFVDLAAPNTGLPGLLVLCESQDGRLAIGFTDTNGYFTVPVASGMWKVSQDSEALLTAGCLDSRNSPSVDTSTGSVAGVTVALPKGTALVYGNVKDNLGVGFPGLGLWADNSTNVSEGSGVTDQNGDYVVAVTAGTWHVEMDSTSPALVGYVGSLGADISLSDGQAVRQDFGVIPGDHSVSGRVLNNSGLPVTGVGVYVRANIGGANYGSHTHTDANGSYTFLVPNGSWNVGLNCSGSDDTLNALGYQCVPEQPLTIANNNGVINFTVFPCAPLQVTTSSPLVTGQRNSFYAITLLASGCNEPFTWLLAPSSQPLPSGLNLQPNGFLSGTPSVAGTFSFTVRVSDNQGNWVDKVFSLTIQNALLQVTTGSLPDATKGGAYNAQLAASGGQSPYSWSLDTGSANLPPGLSLGLGGLLSGVPTVAGQFNFTVKVTDAGFASATRNLGIRVNPPPTISSGVKGPDDTFQFQLHGAAGQTYTIQVSTNLSLWQTRQTIVAPNDFFTVTVGSATNSRTFYRVLVGQ